MEHRGRPIAAIIERQMDPLARMAIERDRRPAQKVAERLQIATEPWRSLLECRHRRVGRGGHIAHASVQQTVHAAQERLTPVVWSSRGRGIFAMIDGKMMAPGG